MTVDLDTPPNEYARFEHLRANVPARRRGYKLLIFFAFLLFVATLGDILFLKSEFMIYLLAGFGVLILVAIIMLVSRGYRAKQIAEPVDNPFGNVDAREDLNLKCGSCKHIFRVKFADYDELVGNGASCPICSTFSRMPPIDSKWAPENIPEKEIYEVDYKSEESGQDISIGTYGDDPNREVKFLDREAMGARPIRSKRVNPETGNIAE